MSAFAAELLLAASGVSFLAVLVIYCVGAFSPGPNNIILLVSGSRVGFWRSVPQILGITAGVAGLCIFQGFVLGAFFQQLPAAYIVLRVIFSLALVWLAWKNRLHPARERRRERGGARPRLPHPLRLPSGVPVSGRQSESVGGGKRACHQLRLRRPGSARRREHRHRRRDNPFTLAATCVWTIFGVSLRAWLREPLRAKIFYRLMAALLLACLIPAYL